MVLKTSDIEIRTRVDEVTGNFEAAAILRLTSTCQIRREILEEASDAPFWCKKAVEKATYALLGAIYGEVPEDDFPRPTEVSSFIKQVAEEQYASV